MRDKKERIGNANDCGSATGAGSCGVGGWGAGDTRSAGKPAASVAGTVNLNTATAAELEALPGVGPAMAQRIVSYRQQSGGFKKIEELMNVQGIGEASFLKLKPLVTVIAPKTDRAVGAVAIPGGCGGMPPQPPGYSLIELLFVTALTAVLAGAVTPRLLAGLDIPGPGGRLGTSRPAWRMARTHAVTRSAHVALRFQPGLTDVSFQPFVDENHNGVRNSDIAGGVDRPLGSPVRLSDLFPGVVIGTTDPTGDPVRIGSSNLLSFTPLGTATPGTIYVRGRNNIELAVRVTGATGRTRILRRNPRSRVWEEVY